ncbi:solute carrier family 13 member 5-like [Gigantopelta aegis]|uniref:solute carrier family 13 member 5-like n=1 Tax=Gigantopelta aegis TaxID=1735272 RepID=UPI001B88D8C8|nr:solute carrier family 13 member 5-like [Gigantopelta aegis]XP_041350288.1 solute carrier family 13 member 5-like [Gigantopelta aegis]
MNEPRKGKSFYDMSAQVVDHDADVVIVGAPFRPSAWSQFLAVWKFLVCVLTPIIFIFFFFIGDHPAYRCAYLIALMAVFWITEAVPIAVTSLLPVFLCPMMGILTAKETSSTYMNDTSMLFVGGLIIAIAIETWNLHKRLALGVLLLFGSEPRWVMAGLMLVTWFLSMWISNTATTAMMIPIAQAILQQMKEGVDVGDDQAVEGIENEGYTAEMEEVSRTTTAQNGVHHDHVNTPQTSASDDDQREDDAKHLRLCKAMSLCVAYAANTGGIASLTGTGPNLVLKGQSDIVFDEYNATNPITFATWMIYGLPLSFIVLIVLWIWLQIVFLRCQGCCSCFAKKGDGAAAKSVRKVILRQYRALGSVSFAQYVIMVMFAILVVLWITRDLGGSGGWGILFKPKYVRDSTPALLIGFLLFILPSSLPNVFCFRKNDDTTNGEFVPILNWKNIHEKMPWSLYLLLGGGFAIAKAATKTGLSKEVGTFLLVFKDLNPWLMLLIICYIITFFTEVTSNTAIATLMMPILAELAKALNVNPLFFMFPTALTTSFAFMLPAATPPNAIVFSYGQVRVIDMALCGFWMNVITVPILIGATASWGNAYFHFDTLPDGFNYNITTTTPG